MISTLLAIHLNTIVHPFLLADNRHYIFYVFRILLRYPAVKYLAAPIYLVCAWSIIQTLGLHPVQAVTEQEVKIAGREREQSKHWAKESNKGAQQDNLKSRGRGFSDVRIGSFLVWLGTCSLCLISAPLVEPRYFIIPWVVWRLWVPSPIVSNRCDDSNKGVKKKNPMVKGGFLTAADRAPDAPARDRTEKRTLSQHTDDLSATRLERQWCLWSYDHRLVIETTWFFILNCFTGYVFLYCGFEWPQEPGKVQRFMW